MTVSTADNPVEAKLEKAIASGLSILVFKAAWCGPCKAQAPILDEISHDDTLRTQIIKLDVDQDPAVSAHYRVRSVPTIVLVKDGQEVDRINGTRTKSQLVAWIQAHS